MGWSIPLILLGQLPWLWSLSQLFVHLLTSRAGKWKSPDLATTKTAAHYQQHYCYTESKSQHCTSYGGENNSVPLKLGYTETSGFPVTAPS